MRIIEKGHGNFRRLQTDTGNGLQQLGPFVGQPIETPHASPDDAQGRPRHAHGHILMALCLVISTIEAPDDLPDYVLRVLLDISRGIQREFEALSGAVLKVPKVRASHLDVTEFLERHERYGRCQHGIG